MTKPRISWPQTPADVRRFLANNYECIVLGDENGNPNENDQYGLSAHDLLSAFSEWVEFVGEHEQSGKFKIGDRVRKVSGSQWKGVVVGTYSTELTPEGYAVESDTEKGSVQIYPAKALELCEQDTVKQFPVASAMVAVTKAMQDDPEYAWAWHCNIAMAFVDAGGDPYTGNQGAARFMKLLANVEPAHELPEAPQFQPQQEPVAWANLNELSAHFESANCGTAYQHPGEGRQPLYITPPQRQPLTDEFVRIPCNLLPRIEHFIAEAIETMEVAGVIIKPDAHQLLADVREAAHGIK